MPAILFGVLFPEESPRLSWLAQTAGTVAGMYSRFFDMFHYTANHNSFAVGYCINVEFGGIIQEIYR